MGPAPANRLELEVKAVDEGQELAASGELDIATVDAFVAAARDQLAQGRLVLDLRELRFMDSTGVRALDGLVADADAAGATMRIRPELHEHVAMVLRLTGMLDVLPIDRAEQA